MVKNAKKTTDELPATVSTAALSKLLGITSQRISQLADAGVVSRAEHGRYLLAPSIAGYVEFMRKAHAESGGGINLRRERAELVRIQKMLAQLEYDRESGKVVEIASVADVVKREYAVVRTALFGLGSRVAPRLALMDHPEEIEALIVDEVNDILEALKYEEKAAEKAA
jgi:phage terminase Nu1 subunit (DNA packaging protein)